MKKAYQFKHIDNVNILIALDFILLLKKWTKVDKSGLEKNKV